jgi:IS4 transposase
LIRENDLPEYKDFHILKDEVIRLTGKASVENEVSDIESLRVSVYIEEDDRTIVLITNNIEWEAATIAELYKRRWLIEIFFKLIKQNLQFKTFLGTNKNACKSQIFITLKCYCFWSLFVAH